MWKNIVRTNCASPSVLGQKRLEQKLIGQQSLEQKTSEQKSSEKKSRAGFEDGEAWKLATPFAGFGSSSSSYSSYSRYNNVYQHDSTSLLKWDEEEKSMKPHQIFLTSTCYKTSCLWVRLKFFRWEFKKNSYEFLAFFRTIVVRYRKEIILFSIVFL